MLHKLDKDWAYPVERQSSLDRLASGRQSTLQPRRSGAGELASGGSPLLPHPLTNKPLRPLVSRQAIGIQRTTHLHIGFGYSHEGFGGGLFR